MAVVLERNLKRYIGLSTDTKPVPGMIWEGARIETTDLAAGSSFLEADTKRIYRFTGTEWALTSGDYVSASSGMTVETEVLQGLMVSNLMMLEELQKIRLILT